MSLHCHHNPEKFTGPHVRDKLRQRVSQAVVDGQAQVCFGNECFLLAGAPQAGVLLSPRDEDSGMWHVCDRFRDKGPEWLGDSQPPLLIGLYLEFQHTRFCGGEDSVLPYRSKERRAPWAVFSRRAWNRCLVVMEGFWLFLGSSWVAPCEVTAFQLAFL